MDVCGIEGGITHIEKERESVLHHIYIYTYVCVCMILYIHIFPIVPHEAVAEASKI